MRTISQKKTGALTFPSLFLLAVRRRLIQRIVLEGFLVPFYKEKMFLSSKHIVTKNSDLYTVIEVAFHITKKIRDIRMTRLKLSNALHC